jgi:hypothetical protein
LFIALFCGFLHPGNASETDSYTGGGVIQAVVRALQEQTIEQARRLIRTLFLVCVGCAADRLRQSCRADARPRHPSPAADHAATGVGGTRRYAFTGGGS